MRFYVYGLTYADEILYVGKGSANRLANQRRAYGLSGHEIARFKRERDAYQFERELIAADGPRLNKCHGGGGSRATPVPVHRKDEFERLMDRIGTKAASARIVYHCWLKGLHTLSWDDAWRIWHVGYGSS